jgi:diadenosine tetraphosphatase ApaH/serine/threonine PP2A family protein phosphatase
LRYLIISDIHGNLEALTAVLADSKPQSYDSIVCLGDFVGYGANPDECVKAMIALPNLTSVLGNHDAAVIDTRQRELFNPVARAGVLYADAHLSAASREFLGGLPLVATNHDFLAVHASPYKPEVWVYVVEPLEAADAFHVMTHPLAFIGHTHFPIVHTHTGLMTPFLPEAPVSVGADHKVIINVGSVGQPRDGDPRAAYVIYDSDAQTVHIHRIAYDIDGAAAKILEAGLPPLLAERLRRGY